MHIPIEDEIRDNLQEKIEIIVEDCEYKNCNSNSKATTELVYDELQYVEPVKKAVESKAIKNLSKIIVQSRLGSASGKVIPKTKINLYMLNGISPKLVASKLTDEEGIAIFDEVNNGSYRVIAIVDKKYFQKPSYIQWNEVTINSNTQMEKITVINRVKINP